MKALSIRQPWAWAILRAGKRIENREWRAPPSYRGPLLIHASKGCTRDEYEDAAYAIRNILTPPRIAHFGGLADLERGGIVGRCNLVDAVWTLPNGCRVAPSRSPIGMSCVLCGVAYQEPARRACSKADPWAVPGSIGLILADVEPLPFLAWKGALGIFDVDDVALSDASDRLAQP
jgi:ASCH domain